MDLIDIFNKYRGQISAVLLGVLVLLAVGGYAMSKTSQQVTNQGGVLGVQTGNEQYLLYTQLENGKTVPHVYDVLNRTEVNLPSNISSLSGIIVSPWSSDGQHILASNAGGDKKIYILSATDASAKATSAQSDTLYGYWKDNNTYEIQNPNSPAKDILVSTDGSVQQVPHDPRTVFSANAIQIIYPSSDTPFSNANTSSLPEVYIQGKEISVSLTPQQYIAGMSSSYIIAVDQVSAPKTIMLYDKNSGIKKIQFTIANDKGWSVFSDPTSIQVIPSSDSILVSEYSGEIPSMNMRIVQINLITQQATTLLQRQSQGVYGNLFVISGDGKNIVYSSPLSEEGQARTNPNKTIVIHNIPTGLETTVAQDHGIIFTTYNPTLLYQAFVTQP